MEGESVIAAVVVGMSITIALPFPDKNLMPNAARRLHWHTRAGYAQTARMIGKVETLNQARDAEFCKADALAVEIEFCEPNKAKRDLDGMLSAIKPTLDGMADALEVDDKQFNPITLRRGERCKGGKVIVSVKRDGTLEF